MTNDRDVGAKGIRIAEYEARHTDAFRDLNLSWIEEYFEVEEIDRKQLLEPEATILDNGGAIFVAEDHEVVLGVCALLYKSPGLYEVTKMAVRKDLRSQGIGRRLLSEVISRAPQLGARKLSILSNTILPRSICIESSDSSKCRFPRAMSTYAATSPSSWTWVRNVLSLPRK